MAQEPVALALLIVQTHELPGCIHGTLVGHMSLSLMARQGLSAKMSRPIRWHHSSHELAAKSWASFEDCSGAKQSATISLRLNRQCTRKTTFDAVA
jgi:hypothetical protein